MKTLVIALAGICIAGPALAATLTFTGTALPTCSLATPTDGVLTLQADLQSWATTVPATINVVNTAPATLSVTRGADWASSPANTPTTTFNYVATMTGVNVGTLVGVNDVRSGPLTALGLTTLSVSLSATASAPYKAGIHVAQMTVTCTVP